MALSVELNRTCFQSENSAWLGYDAAKFCAELEVVKTGVTQQILRLDAVVQALQNASWNADAKKASHARAPLRSYLSQPCDEPLGEDGLVTKECILETADMVRNCSHNSDDVFFSEYSSQRMDPGLQEPLRRQHVSAAESAGHKTSSTCEHISIRECTSQEDEPASERTQRSQRSQGMAYSRGSVQSDAEGKRSGSEHRGRLFKSMHEVDTAQKKFALSRMNSAKKGGGTFDELPPSQQRIRLFVEHSRFEVFFGVMVCTNSILIGVETDWAARHPGATPPLTFYGFSLVYALIFSLELVLRILSKRCRFFYDRADWHWNYFDLVSVVGAVVEIAFTTLYMAGQGGDSRITGAAQVRLLKILRTTRLLRFFRISRVLRFVRALRTLVFSIIDTLKSLFWAMILLVLIIYSFAVIFTQAVSEEFGDTMHLHEDSMEDLQEFWGNLSRSMLTLFMALSDGISWKLAAEPLGQNNRILLYLFLLYIVFTCFAVVNVITAVFVQSSVDNAKSDQEHMIQTVLSQQTAYSAICRSLFRKIDDNDSGQINLTEFFAHYEEVEVQALFEALELEPEDAWSLFKLLDGGQNHTITEKEFIEGCMKCRGQAKRVDMFMFVEHYAYTTAQMLGFMARAEAHLRLISGADPKDLFTEEDLISMQQMQSDLQAQGGGISARIQRRIGALVADAAFRKSSSLGYREY